jgi:hypothetical protein
VKNPCGAGSVSAVKASAILVGRLHAELIRAVCAVCASPVNRCFAHRNETETRQRQPVGRQL